MYTYPLKFEFPLISLGRQVNVTDAGGRFIMRVTDPFFTFKDALIATDASGNVVYNINGDTSFRFMFQLASMSTVWNVQAPNGEQLASFDQRYFRMDEFNDLFMERPSAMTADGKPSLGGIAGQMAANMVNFEVDRRLPRKLVYRVQDKEEGGTALGWIVPTRGTAWFDVLPYSTRIQILKLPFVGRAYTPSYEFKLGNRSGETSLKLQKQRDLLIDRYILEKVGDLSEADERWAIPALALATLFERTRLKEMADW